MMDIRILSSKPFLGLVLLVFLVQGLAAQVAPGTLSQMVGQWEEWVSAAPDERPPAEEALQAAEDLLAAADALVRQDQPDRALGVLEVLSSDASVDFLNERAPPGVDEFMDELRLANGRAYFRRGEQAILRGDRTSAERDYRIAGEQYFQPGENGYARAWSQMGVLYHDRGMEHLAAGREVDGVANLNASAGIYLNIIENPPPDASLVRTAERNIERLIGLGVPLDVPGLPDPEPEPEPDREPNFIERIIGEDAWSDIVDFGESLLEDRGLHEALIFWGVVIAAFVAVYWVIPRWVLLRAGRGGSIAATTWIPWVRLLGTFALIGWIGNVVWNQVRYRQRKAKAPLRPRCVKCRAALDEPFAYEDFVFSRCPACKAPVTPVYTTEKVIRMLSDGLASEAEGVGEDTHALQRHVRNDAVQRLTQALITLAVRRRASDLHVEPVEDCLLIRQRIDGIMTEMFRLPRSLAITIVSSLKVKADMNIAEKRVPQDGKFQVRIDNTDIDVRAASSPVGTGEKISLRLLDIRSIRLDVEQLGMSKEGQEVFRRSIQEPHGLILVTGPTGSGKTTTIYVALQSISSGEKNIISIEDPVEFRIPGVNQIQVNPTAGLTFASGLRSILRQDPDVLLVGEIRDQETAEISVNAATTGHLVFTTLHTIDAASSVARLIDLGVGARQFADALALVVAQRLIRLVCEQCKEPYVPPDSVLAEIGLLQDDVEGATFQRGRGCKLCNKTGYHRRTGVFEILDPSERLRDAIENENLTTAAIRDLAIRGGMKTLRQEAIRYLLEGRTTAEETLRVTR